MNEISTKLADRAERKTRKREEKRRQIAASAIEALTQLGYANTSMRDIASVSDMSLGMLNYYFGDKSDLIIYCVTNYKSDFVHACQAAISAEGDRDTVLDTLVSGFATTIRNDAASHRLWFDIRTQAMFDEAFHAPVRDIETRLIGVVELLHDRLGVGPQADPVADYAAIEGLFLHWIHDEDRAAQATEQQIKASFRHLIDRLW